MRSLLIAAVGMLALLSSCASQEPTPQFPLKVEVIEGHFCMTPEDFQCFYSTYVLGTPCDEGKPVEKP